jgi:hypothetical protein
VLSGSSAVNTCDKQSSTVELAFRPQGGGTPYLELSASRFDSNHGVLIQWKYKPKGGS